MKILHTSDWHLGHTLYSYDRTAEQISMLLQMVRLASLQQPDLLIIAGDIFHTPQPSTATQKMFTEAIVAIHEAQPEMHIVAIAGNHDSSTKHEIFRTPWASLNVHMIGHLDREAVENHIITLPGKGYVIAIPYTYERNIPKGFHQQLIDEVSKRNREGLPVVMVAHTSVRGSDFRGHDNADDHTVGGIDSVDIDALGTGYDYLALGHIHHRQSIAGNPQARYSGSPLPVSFDENYPHSVSIIEIDKHGDRPLVRECEIENSRPLVTLPSTGAASWEDAKRLLADFPAGIPAYIRLQVETEDRLPTDAHAEAMMLTEDKACRFCMINISRTAHPERTPRTLTIQDFKEEDPIDIARRYAGDTGAVFDEDMEQLFREAQQTLYEHLREQ